MNPATSTLGTAAFFSSIQPNNKANNQPPRQLILEGKNYISKQSGLDTSHYAKPINRFSVQTAQTTKTKIIQQPAEYKPNKTAKSSDTNSAKPNTWNSNIARTDTKSQTSKEISYNHQRKSQKADISHAIKFGLVEHHTPIESYDHWGEETRDHWCEETFPYWCGPFDAETFYFTSSSDEEESNNLSSECFPILNDPKKNVIQ